MQQKSQTNILLAAILAAGALFLAGCGHSADQSHSGKLSDVARLRQVKKGEEPTEKLRIVQLAPDGITKAGALIQYFDGRTAVVHYRTSGAHKGAMTDAKVFFAVPQDKDKPSNDSNVTVDLKPLEATLTGRKLAREMEFDIDGHTFLKDNVYSEDGTLTHAGRLTMPSIYDAYDLVTAESPTALKIDFTPGAATRAVSRHQEYIKGKDSKWVLGLDEAFFADGVLQTSGTYQDDNGSFVTQTFNHDRLLLNKATKDRYGSSLATEFYQADGKTLKTKTVQTSYSVTAEQYDLAGVISERRVWGYGYNSMDITYFVAGKPSFTQSWARPSDTKDNADGTIDGSKYVITKLQVTDAKGNTVKVIDLGDDHKTPVRVTILTPGSGSFWDAHTLKTFRPDGTLDTVQVYAQGGKLLSTKKYTAAQKIREPLKATYLQARPFEQPAKMLPQVRRTFRGGFNPFF